ncbi:MULTISPECIES: hypothetical protein [unclassified Acinetobacter]|uniref:hypothetical protein n=1 Tax=unclassified Acinetobacter TaxID=196816 RepID=UPI0035BAEAAC
MPEQTSNIESFFNRFLSLFDGIPEATIAVTVYVGGTLLALYAWYGITRRIPSPFGGILWVILFAILATPTISEGENAGVAPAIIGVLFGILTKEKSLITNNIMLIALVMSIGFLVHFCWLKYKENLIKTGELDG